MIQKERLALAALGSVLMATEAAAQALEADVELYGTLVPHLELIATAGATSLSGRGGATQVPNAAFTGIDEPGRLRMTPGTSHLGVRGTVGLLGDALAVVWQIESGVPLDGDLAESTIASRNSRVGLTGSWGTVFFGIWDNPYKWASLPIVNPIAAGFVADYTALIGSPGFGVGALESSPGYVENAAPGSRPGPRSNAAFYRRDANSIQYWSPTFYGLSARVSYTANELSRAERPLSGTAAALAEISPGIFSGLLSYDNGPLELRYGIELHNDYFGVSLLGGSPGGTSSNPNSEDVGQQGVAAYSFSFSPELTTRVVATVDYLFYENDDNVGGNVDQYQRAAFYALVDQSYQSHHAWLAYGQADSGRCSLVGDSPCSTDGLGARMLTLGYLYRFSPNTDVYAAAYHVVNKSSSTYAPFPPNDPLPAPGANLRSIGVGILHRFSATLSTGQ